MKLLRSLRVGSVVGAFFVAAAEGPQTELPLHPDDLKVILRIVEREKLDAPADSQPKGWPLRPGETGVRFSSKDNPRHTLLVIYDASGRVTDLRGNGPLLCNDALTWLAALPELRGIRIDHNTPASNVDRQLYDGSGFGALKHSKLEQVRIGHAFTDRGMAALAGIASLRSIDICHSFVTDAGIAHLARHPNLEEFTISSQARPDRVTEKCLPTFATMPKLKRLNLHETFLTYDGGLKHLKPLKGQLQAISFKGSLVLPADVEKLRQDHPGIEITTSAPAEILGTPNSRGLLKWASPEAIEYLKLGERR
ncbi:MAG: hypothetical protein NZ700_05520 [Gemmataceae bacterium]|nr:hypothetical protein [Gemmataceae bacterium]MDW8266108.1 hypothetical protein [Gemmataceae bacterium]